MSTVTTLFVSSLPQLHGINMNSSTLVNEARLHALPNVYFVFGGVALELYSMLYV